MRVLTFTSLFPNVEAPELGGFVARRMEAWAARHATAWAVVAPVPYFPPLPGPARWRRHARVQREEKRGPWRVLHPRYGMVPRFGGRLQGRSMAAFCGSAVRRLVREEGPFDLMDAHYVYPDGYAAMLLCRSLGLPLVVSARGSDVNLYGSLPGIGAKVAQVLKSAQAVVGVSRALVRRMVELGAAAERCQVVSNGVDATAFQPDPGRGVGVPAAEVLAVGNLVHEKGFDLLVEAVAVLAADGAAPRVAVVGEGPGRAALEARTAELDLSEKIRFVGSVPHVDLPAWYRAAGVFCLPSRREGCPNVVLEALSSGLPVVAMPVGGVPELVRPGGNGVLAEAVTAPALARALRECMARSWDPQAVRATVGGRSWEGVADAVEAVFRSAVPAGGGR